MGADEKQDQPPASYLTTQVVDAAPQPENRRGIFLVQSGLDAGRVLPIPPSAVVSVGRAAECTFAFDDASLSREHAHLFYAVGHYVVKDNGSTNGSFVNDVRITAAKQLNDGDRVQFGSSTVLRFSLVDDAE